MKKNQIEQRQLRALKRQLKKAEDENRELKSIIKNRGAFLGRYPLGKKMNSRGTSRRR